MKISRLQQQILLLALANREREKRTSASAGADVYYRDILIAAYQFPEPRAKFGGRQGGKQFNPEQIGRARYNAAMAAVSRAVSRLDKRGLVVAMAGRWSRWSGCSLTDAGIEMANGYVSPKNCVNLTAFGEAGADGYVSGNNSGNLTDAETAA